MTIAKHIEGILTKSSWIRKMFEEGGRLKAIHGAENVYDFSLGNPNLDPPEAFKTILKTLLDHETPGCHGYMPNTGYPEVRKAVADYLCSEQGVSISASEIIMTCGAAGGLNVILKALLDPGDEILTPTPHFVEYGFYVGNHGGVLKTVPTHPDFTLNIEAISNAITPRTKAVLINSPNNPTGQIYSREDLEKLAAIMTRHSERTGRPVFLLSDEPYRFLNYDNVEIPSVFSIYKYSVIASSFSKKLSLAGARIGYLAVNPAIEDPKDLINGAIMTNRILGFVNAPALAQNILQHSIDCTVDIDIYRQRRDAMAAVLDNAGIKYSMPRGAFYFFPQSPVEDDSLFIKALVEEHVLAVPGVGFGYPGWQRMAFQMVTAQVWGRPPVPCR